MSVPHIKGPTQQATTVRAAATALFCVDSADRFKTYTEESAATTINAYNASPYDFSIVKNESLMNGFFTRLAVSEVQIPWNIPNVNYKTNSIVFKWKVGAGPIQTATLQLNVGFYIPQDFAQILETTIQLTDPALANVNVSYQDNLRFTVVSIPANPNLKFAFEPTPYGAIYPYNSASTINLFHMMGFNDSNKILDTSHFSKKATFFQYTPFIDITCPQLTYNQGLKDTTTQQASKDTLCRIYLTDGNFNQGKLVAGNNFCPPGCSPMILHRQFTNPKFIYWSPNQPIQGNLQFQVVDADGQVVGKYEPAPGNISGNTIPYDIGVDWQMSILVSEN